MIKILQLLRLKAPEFDDEEEHDDELADFGGEADVALVALSVAAHVAAIALLHRSARAFRKREQLRAAAEVIARRLARRGDAPLGRQLEAAVRGLGTTRFEATLKGSTGAAARELQSAPLKQLERLVGPVAAKELLGRTSFRAAKLAPRDADKVATHLIAGAELQVGLGKGSVFAPLIAPGTRVLTLKTGSTEIRVWELKPR